jgi:plastocyanin
VAEDPEAGRARRSWRWATNVFKPKTVQGNAGQKVTLELKNEGTTEHNFTLSDQRIDQDVGAGKTASVTVTIPKSGTLTFYCKYYAPRA